MHNTLALVEPNLSQIAQNILQQYYWTAFPMLPSKVIAPNPKAFTVLVPGVARVVHGAMHASRVAAYIKMLHQLRLACEDPEALLLQALAEGYWLSSEQLMILIQLAGLFHDTARENEAEDHWDAESAANYQQFLKANYPDLAESLVLIFYNALRFKDLPAEFHSALQHLNLGRTQSAAADYLRQLIA